MRSTSPSAAVLLPVEGGREDLPQLSFPAIIWTQHATGEQIHLFLGWLSVLSISSVPSVREDATVPSVRNAPLSLMADCILLCLFIQVSTEAAISLGL